MLVRVIKDWDWPDIMHQTAGGNGRWDDIQFTTDPVENCDYVIVINRVTKDTEVICPPNQIWGLSQEPPVPEYKWVEQGYQQLQRVFTPETDFTGEKYVHTHGALPWHIDKSFNELKTSAIPEKNSRLSWITSNKSSRSGHKARLAFLDKIKGQVDFDLWGRGFQPLNDKWDGLAPYRYGLAIENHHGPYYWTEKIADCFLSWTMPIYYGCSNITDYFPQESLITIDINDPSVGNQIEEIIHTDLWLKNRDAVAYARDLVLHKYQFFPFIVEQIRHNQEQDQSELTQRVQLKELLPMRQNSAAGRIRRHAAKLRKMVNRD